MALLALLLAIVWVPLTSHELLEAAGVIHHDGADADAEPAHEAADGLYRAHDGAVLLKAPTFALLGILTFAVVLSCTPRFVPRVIASYLRRETASPPGLSRRWHFLQRLALPSQSPSFAL